MLKRRKAFSSLCDVLKAIRRIFLHRGKKAAVRADEAVQFRTARASVIGARHVALLLPATEAAR